MVTEDHILPREKKILLCETSATSGRYVLEPEELSLDE